MRHSRCLFERPRQEKPAVSLILLDWCVRESFHTLDYLAAQTAERDDFEVVWIEYYDRVAEPIADCLDRAKASGVPAPLDLWLLLDMPRSAYYHKHLMYNVGLLASRGRIVVIRDSDAMVKPTFVAAIAQAFDEDASIVLHLDEVRNVDRAYYPFNAPSFEALEGDGAINWRSGKTTGIQATQDRVHQLNYGACFCALRDDLLLIGGADESVDYLGHVCGPYELTWRLGNAGRREVWHESEFLYHTWHPGTDGDENYLGPHDGRNVSTTALEARRSGRILPLVENPAVRLARTATPLPTSIGDLIDLAVGGRDTGLWAIDDKKRMISAGRVALGRGDHAEALRQWAAVVPELLSASAPASDLGWARYFANQYAPAREAFEASLLLDASNPSALRGLAWTARQQQRYAEAVRLFTRVLEADPDDEIGALEARRGRGWAAMLAGAFDDAIADFDHVVRHASPTDHATLQDAYRGRGWSLIRSGNAVNALEAFGEALRQPLALDHPGTADALHGQDEARRAAADVVARAPSAGMGAPPVDRLPADAVACRIRASLHASLGWAHLDHHNYNAALDAFGQALQLHADDLDAQSGDAWVRSGRDRGESLEIVERVLTVAADRDSPVTLARALRARAWMRVAAGEFTLAIKDFTRALAAMSPADQVARADTLEGRAYAYYRAGRTAEARLDSLTGRGRISASSARLALDMLRLRRRVRRRAVP